MTPTGKGIQLHRLQSLVCKSSTWLEEPRMTLRCVQLGLSHTGTHLIITRDGMGGDLLLTRELGQLFHQSLGSGRVTKKWKNISFFTLKYLQNWMSMAIFCAKRVWWLLGVYEFWNIFMMPKWHKKYPNRNISKKMIQTNIWIYLRSCLFCCFLQLCFQALVEVVVQLLVLLCFEQR